MTSCLTDAEFELFRHLIREQVGISVSHTNLATLQRKLTSRLRYLALDTYHEYYNYLVRGEEGRWELRRLINAITVDQTAFFRHPKQFEHLANIMLPEIREKKGTGGKLRIWSAGCSTGEEAYSIAMVVNEMFGGDNTWDIRILASDIDTNALKFAFKGLYTKSGIRPVPSEYVDKYFTQEVGSGNDSYAVREELKKNVLFRRLNFMKSKFPFRSAADIIFCRNVMIYFHADFKKRLIDRFFQILDHDGFLCLGASESLVGVDSRFALLGHAIYQKQG